MKQGRDWYVESHVCHLKHGHCIRGMSESSVFYVLIRSQRRITLLGRLLSRQSYINVSWLIPRVGGERRPAISPERRR